jgi:hypothetical protein
MSIWDDNGRYIEMQISISQDNINTIWRSQLPL